MIKVAVPENLAVYLIKWRSSLILALRSLWLHKLRAILSAIGHRATR